MPGGRRDGVGMVPVLHSVLRLLLMSDRENDVEILVLRHQLTVLQRQLGDRRPRLRPEDRAFLAALLVRLSRSTVRRLRLLVSPDRVLRWHRAGWRQCRSDPVTDGGQSRQCHRSRRRTVTSPQASPAWLGHHAIPGQIRQSGLWNVEHVTQPCDPDFLHALEQLIQQHR
jgi:hypothetical protein